MSLYLNQIDPDHPCEDFPPADQLACPFPFPLDPFQKHAVKAIHKGENVLVTAKTGSGKTLVGEYLVHHCLKQGKRVFYTTPIKSLSNQKFHDLKRMFPSVGLMTGDLKYRPDAQILIMTTEILRNLLYKQGSSTQTVGLTAQISLEGLGGVVFDECHYINDRERGKVWEETMILLKPEIQLVLLSATIDKPELFAAWLGDLKQVPIHLISTSYRIVPLEHAVFLGQHPQLLMENKEVFYADAYKRYLDWREQKRKEKDVKEKQVAARKAGGWENAVVKGGGLPAFNHQLNECIQYLQAKTLMPALFFVFSRKGCETLAHQVQGSLIDSSDAAAIRHIWDFHLHKHKEVLEHLPQAHILKDLVMRGIAFHHSGVLPMLRELVELLFGRGLLKVLFATETFAVGINMPTKTVVFLDLEKYSDETQGMRMLRTDEYIQMAGRAGRRGKDEKGYVFYLPQRTPVSLSELQSMMTGKKSAITSQMDFGYDFVLKTFQSKSVRWIELMENSYWYRQVQGELKEARLLEQSLKEQRDALGLTDEQIQTGATRKALEAKAKSATNAAKKEAQKQVEALKNKQVGPEWTKLFSSYEIYTLLEGKLAQMRAEIASLESLLKTKIHPTLQLLQRWGFLNDSQELTELGILATEFNEGQPILMAKAFEAGVWKDLSTEDFVGFLAAFLQEGKGDTDPAPSELRLSGPLQDALNFVDELAYQCKKDEEPYQLTFAREGMWEIRTGWIEPLQRWMSGEDAATLCKIYGLYEGTFLRSVLKVANLVEEWIAIATYTKTIELLQTLEGVRATLVRGIVKPESLYLTLD